LLEFASGGITAIGTGVKLSRSGTQTLVALSTAEARRYRIRHHIVVDEGRSWNGLHTVAPSSSRQCV
jgi:hypothetical protein